MEILQETNAPISCLIILGIVIGGAFLIWGAWWFCEENFFKKRISYNLLIVGALIVIGGVVLGKIGSPSWKRYTIEINDKRAYQYLIENNYSVNERLYDSKNVYIITGKPLPAEWETDW